MDIFGPFFTKEGRKELKRYDAIFICLASRAIHLEVVNSMDKGYWRMKWNDSLTKGAMHTENVSARY